MTEFNAEQVMQEILAKLEITSKQIGTAFPINAKDGIYERGLPHVWTSGFWPGILWLAYDVTKNEEYKNIAIALEEQMDSVISNYHKLHHDMGFMWLLTSGYHYNFDQNAESKKRLLHTANLLAGRFNINGNFFRAWNDGDWDENTLGCAIVDCTMNMPLLVWASALLQDPRYKHMAIRYYNTVLNTFINPDGSIKHICDFDAETGVLLRVYAGQGYAPDSAWSRGASWGIYGMAMAYSMTKDHRYLAAAEKMSRYFIENLNEQNVSPWDFKAPNKEIVDTSASACAASGMIEIAKYADDGSFYLDAAKKILNGIYQNYSCLHSQEESLITGATAHCPKGNGLMTGIIYADYYFVEAVKKLQDPAFKLPWLAQ